MKDLVLKHWSNEEILGGTDCFVKEDGTVILFSCYNRIINNEQINFCSPFCETTVDSLEKYNQELWTQFDVFTNRYETVSGDIIFGGEGCMGNQGFIVCIDGNNNLKWSYFFLNSNPFYKIEIIDDKICAYSSLDLVYQIDIHNLEKIIVEYKEWRN